MDNSNFIIDIENTCFDTEAMLKRDCGIENIEKLLPNILVHTVLKWIKKNIKQQLFYHSVLIYLPFSTER